MCTNAGPASPEQDLDLVQRRHRGRSVREGTKVVAVVTVVLALIVAAVIALMPGWGREIALVGGAVGMICTAFVLFFFRDAEPQPPFDQRAILSPAHGTIDYIDRATETQFLNGPAQRVSIYLSLWNVHVQNAPVSGSVEVVEHFPGRWTRARQRESSLRNEHLLVGLSFAGGRKVALRLISGIWVRRIVPWITPGQRITGGERIGLIRFGSRVDVFLPVDFVITVQPGDKVRGGETVLARFSAA